MKANTIEVLPRLAFVTNKDTGEADINKVEEVENDAIIRMLDNEKMSEDQLSEIKRLTILNKPHTGGLWTSPIVGDRWCEWLDIACDDESYDLSCIYEVIPDGDCRVLVIDSIHDYLEFEKEYEFDFERIKKDYDIMYVTAKGVAEGSAPWIKIHRTGMDVRPIFKMGLLGWDLESALFLRKKFRFGEKIKTIYGHFKGDDTDD